jgi:hypothetical protein
LAEVVGEYDVEMSRRRPECSGLANDDGQKETDCSAEAGRRQHRAVRSVSGSAGQKIELDLRLSLGVVLFCGGGGGYL